MPKAPDPGDLQSSLDRAGPPASAAAELRALWWVRNGDWDRAHRTVQDLNTNAAAWVHAYLHRVEGDLDNAAYWYSRAGQPVCVDSLEIEWQTLVARFAR